MTRYMMHIYTIHVTQGCFTRRAGVLGAVSLFICQLVLPGGLTHESHIVGGPVRVLIFFFSFALVCWYTPVFNDGFVFPSTCSLLVNWDCGK